MRVFYFDPTYFAMITVVGEVVQMSGITWPEPGPGGPLGQVAPGDSVWQKQQKIGISKVDIYLFMSEGYY